MVFDPQCQSYVPKSAALAISGEVFLQPGMRADLFIPLEPARFSPARRQSRRWTSLERCRPDGPSPAT